MNRLIARFKEPQVWGFFLSVAILAIISIAFFYPDAVEGNTLRQADMQQGAANGQEALSFYEATGEKALWTNSLFGGMPTFQISPTYPSNALFDWLNSVYGLGLPSPSNLLFMMMFGFLILLYVMKMRWYYALAGSIAWGFSSYFIIIIGAGHIWKFVTLSYVPPTIAGLILVYRGRYVMGAAMLSLFAMLQLNANHPQMSYYFFFVMLAMVIACLVTAYKEKTLRRWAIATAVTVGAGMLAVGANLPSLYNTYEYAKETKRSQSELTPTADETRAADPDAARPTGGMPREQIVGWSYGISESFSLLVPDIKGGASARPEGGQMTYLSLDKLPEAAGFANSRSSAILPYFTQYFNDSEGTNGPVYVGAIIFVLFLLGCFIVKGPMKWALVIMTVISIFLAWGRNFETLTDLMIYNFPLYNKFRAVESILVIAEFTMPLLAIMALHKLFTSPDVLKRYKKPLIASFGIPAAICLLAMFAPSVFGDAITATDRATAQSIQQQVADMAAGYGMSRADTDAMLYQYSLTNPANASVIENLRYGMVKSDGLRSLIFIAFAALVIFFSLRGKIKTPVAVGLIGLLILVDLYKVDKRYVSTTSFCTPEVAAADPFAPDAIDRVILGDTAGVFRVMDIPGFDSPNRSYHHKMIGGYHAAKLNRYEDMINRRINSVRRVGYWPEFTDDSVVAQYDAAVQPVIRQAVANYKVLDMLNARYIITGDKDEPVVRNDNALGNAWLVDNIVWADGANAEMDGIDDIDVRHEAIADRRFAEILGEAPTLAPGDTIYMTSYSPNTLRYHATTARGGIGVFSEVYFPWGWHATVDGTPVPLARVNYLLRAMRIPAGSHEIVMTFDPESIHYTSAIAYACVTLIYLLVFAGLFFDYIRCKPKD